MIKKFISKSMSTDTKRGLKNSLYLTVANILTKIIILIGFVYIPNRLGVNEFGMYSAALSFIGIFAMFSFSGVAKVVIRDFINDQQSFELIFNKILHFKVAIGILQVIGVIVTALLIPTYEMQLVVIIIIASNEVFFKNLKSIPSAILQAAEDIKILSKITVVHSLVRVSGMMLILFIENNLMHMMLYIAIVNSIFLFIYFKVMNKRISYKLLINLKNIIIPKKIFYPSLMFTIIAVGTSLSTKVDVFMLSFMGSLESVGVYSLAEKIVLQFEMLRSVLLMAFYPITIKHFKSNTMKLKNLFLISIVIIILTTLLAIIYSENATAIINLLYTDEFQQTAEISAVLVFYLVFLFANLPFSTALQAVGLEKIILYMIPMTIIMNIVLNYYLYNIYGVIGFAYSTLAVQFFTLLFFMVVGSYQLKKKGFVE